MWCKFSLIVVMIIIWMIDIFADPLVISRVLLNQEFRFSLRKVKTRRGYWKVSFKFSANSKTSSIASKWRRFTHHANMPHALFRAHWRARLKVIACVFLVIAKFVICLHWNKCQVNHMKARREGLIKSNTTFQPKDFINWLSFTYIDKLHFHSHTQIQNRRSIAEKA